MDKILTPCTVTVAGREVHITGADALVRELAPAVRACGRRERVRACDLPPSGAQVEVDSDRLDRAAMVTARLTPDGVVLRPEVCPSDAEGWRRASLQEAVDAMVAMVAR